MPQPSPSILNLVEEQLPKALAGLLVPAIQLGWKLWQQRQNKSRAAALRNEITQLTDFLQRLGASPAEGQIRKTTEEQRQKALSALEELMRAPHTKLTEAARTGVRGRLRSIFLLYTPRSVKGWFAHSLFYVFFVFFAITVIAGLGMALGGDPAEEWGAVFAAAAVYAIPTVLLWRWANRISSPFREAKTLSPRWRWVPTALIWTAAFIGASATMGLSMNDQDEFSMAALRQNIGPLVLALALCAVTIVASLRWRRRIDAHRPKGPRWGWVPVALIVISSYVQVVATFAAFMDDNDDLTWSAFQGNLKLFLTLTAICTPVIVLSAIWRRRMKKAITLSPVLTSTSTLARTTHTAASEEIVAK